MNTVCHAVGYCFVLSVVSFALQKLFSFMRSHVIVYLSVCATGVPVRMLSSVPAYAKLFPTFSFIKFNVTGLMLRYLIHLERSFVQGDKYGSICIILHACIQLCQYCLLQMLFPPLHNGGFFAK